MDKKEPLICQNVKRLKRKKKEFSHFGDYLITYATLSGIFANLCTNYIPDDYKTTYMVAISLILEVMYIIAISTKIASHYSIKEYIKEYQQEKLIQKKAIAKEVCAPLTVTSKNTEEANKEEFNRLINEALACNKLKKFFKKLILVLLSVLLLILADYLIFLKKISGFMIIAVILVTMCITFPIASIMDVKEMCRYVLLLYIYMGKSKDSES